jgi:hypothetical protein
MNSAFRCLVVLLALLLVVVDGRADTTPTPLRVHVQSDAPEIQASAIEAAITRELGRPVQSATSATSELLVRVDASRRARLEFATGRPANLTRSIDLPNEADRAMEMIALLAGNLVRDEASELLRELRAEQQASVATTGDTKPNQEQRVAERAGAMPAKSSPASKPVQPNQPAPADAGAAKPKLASSRELPLRGTSLLNLSLFHPIALYRDSDRRAFNFELGLAYARVGGIDGAALELGVLDLRHHANGFVYALALLNRGPTTGFVVSSLFSYSRGSLNGLELAGGVAYRNGPVDGVQLAPALSVASDVTGFLGAAGLSIARDVDGAVVSAGVSIATGRTQGAVLAGGVTLAGTVDGMQASAGFNVARRVDGFQAAGGVNVAETVSGVQAAGGINIAGEVDGLSLAPLNVARRVRGLQLGIVNVADEVDGAALGVVSVAKNGRIQPEFFVSANAPLNVGVRFVVGYAYSELAFGYQPNDERGVPQMGAGAHFSLSPRISLEAGVAYSTEAELRQNFDNTNDELHYRVRVGFRPVQPVELFAGAGVRHGLRQAEASKLSPDLMAGIAFF